MKRTALAVLFLSTLTLLAMAGLSKLKIVDDFTPFAPGEYCSGSVSVDGELAAGAEDRTGHLYYYDFRRREYFYTNIYDAQSPSLKGLQVAYSKWLWDPTSGTWQSSLFIYDIATGVESATGITSARRHNQWVPNRYFDGKHLAYSDRDDDLIKIYSVTDGSILNTGLQGTNSVTVDGDYVSFENSYNDSTGAWKSEVVLYQISTGESTIIDSGFDPVVAGGVVVYMSGSYWNGSLSYYAIKPQKITDTGFRAYTYSTDGNRLVFEVRNEPIAILDLDSGRLEETGIYGCSGGDSCWLDISGRYVAYERWEGGTEVQTDSGWLQVYSPAELNNDTIEHCAAGWFRN